MYNWITDRKQENIDRLNELRNKGWSNMTTAERAEWTGDPLTAADMGYEGAVNLFPIGSNKAYGATAKWRNTQIDVGAIASVNDAYVQVKIGDAADFVDKTFTLSMTSVFAPDGITPLLSLYWSDDSGAEGLGVRLSAAGRITFTATGNNQNRAYLVARLYISGDRAPEIGEFVRYNGVMLEHGSEQHSYVPYTEVLPTLATKGGFNYSDLNRISRAITEIGELLNLTIDVEHSLGPMSVPLYKSCQMMIDGIDRIRSAFAELYVELPETPTSMESLTFEGANQIEIFLATAYAAAIGRG